MNASKIRLNNDGQVIDDNGKVRITFYEDCILLEDRLIAIEVFGKLTQAHSIWWASLPRKHIFQEGVNAPS